MTTSQMRRTVTDFQVGEITNWSDRKNCGNAVVGRGDDRSRGIELLWANCRVVKVDSKDPEFCVITDEPATQAERRRVALRSRVVMTVVDSPDGLKAEVWGLSPG